MVTFCMRCGVSLPPFTTTLIKDGKEIPSPHYTCSACGKSAGTTEDQDKADENDIGGEDIIIKGGKAEKQK